MELEQIYNRYTFGKEYFDICKEAILRLTKEHKETVFKDEEATDQLKQQVAVLKIYKGKFEKKFKEYEEATQQYLDREKAAIDKIGYTPKQPDIADDRNIIEVQAYVEEYGPRFFTLAMMPDEVDPDEARSTLESWTDDEFDALQADWTKTNDVISDKVKEVADLINSVATCDFEEAF